MMPSGRRNFVTAALRSLAAGLLGSRAPEAAQAAPPPASSADDAAVNLGGPLSTHIRRGHPATPPLDTLILMERGDHHDGRAMTHEVLSLIHEETGKNSFPWTLYASLATHHDVGDACVHCARLHKYGRGWSSGLHSEVFSHGPGVALGVNIEMQSDYIGPESPEVIGLNIQPTGGTRTMPYAVQIQKGAGKFETGIGLNGAGAAGIDLKGDYTVGVHMRANSVRLNEGACIELEETGRIRLRYREGRIEFLNGDKCFGHLDVNGEDHAL